MIAAIVAATMTPGGIGDEVPDDDDNESTEQRLDQRDGLTGYGEIARDSHLHDACEQPDPQQGGNNSADNAEWESPADDGLRDQADHRRDCQVDYHAESNHNRNTKNVARQEDSIGQRKHRILPLLNKTQYSLTKNESLSGI